MFNGFNGFSGLRQNDLAGQWQCGGCGRLFQSREAAEAHKCHPADENRIEAKLDRIIELLEKLTA